MRRQLLCRSKAFVADYQAAGGDIALEHVDLPPHTEHSLDMSGLGGAFATMARFVRGRAFGSA